MIEAEKERFLKIVKKGGDYIKHLHATIEQQANYIKKLHEEIAEQNKFHFDRLDDPLFSPASSFKKKFICAEFKANGYRGFPVYTVREYPDGVSVNLYLNDGSMLWGDREHKMASIEKAIYLLGKEIANKYATKEEV